MSNIDGTLSLSEVAAKVERSHAWVKKIEKKFNLPVWGSGQRGKRSSYEFGEVDVFRKIKVLSDLGLTLKEIKTIYDAEQEIRKFMDRNFCIDENTKKEKMTGYNLYIISDVYPTDYDKAKYETDKDKASQLDKMYKEYSEAIKIVAGLLVNRQEELKEELRGIQGIIGV